MVHGACSSAGCFAMTDNGVAEVYAEAQSAFRIGQSDFQVQSFPFRMTAEQMAKHQGDPRGLIRIPKAVNQFMKLMLHRGSRINT